jgi:hypothetical protein
MNEITIDLSSNSPNKTTEQLDYILIDGSGSMMDKWWDTLAAVEAYVQRTKLEGVRSRVMVQVFDDHDLDYRARDCQIASWVPTTVEPIGANWGFSPVYDAINVMCRKLRDMDPPRASIVVVTDGDANHNRFTDLTQAKAMLDWCRAKGWQVTFIGAEYDNSKQARELGASPSSYIGVATKMLAPAIDALAKKRARYAVDGTPMHYTEEERQKFGGYLGGPAK